VVLRRFVETLDVIDLEGKRWAPERLRGRVTLVAYWATWCPECWAELPTLRRLRERYTRSDFEIIGVSVDVTSRRDVVSWLHRHRIDWPQVHDGRGFQGDLTRLLGVKSVPFSFLLDRQGRPVAVNLRGEALARAVDVLLTP
jgi:peroxiredoxin